MFENDNSRDEYMCLWHFQMYLKLNVFIKVALLDHCLYVSIDFSTIHTVTRFQVTLTSNRPPHFYFFWLLFLHRKWIEMHVSCTYRGTHTFTYITPSMFSHLRWRLYTCSILINDSLSNKIPFTLSERKEHEAVKEKKEEKHTGTWQKANNNKG